MMACAHPRCECMNGPETCAFKPENAIITNPVHGGKVTCIFCSRFMTKANTAVVMVNEERICKSCITEFTEG